MSPPTHALLLQGDNGKCQCWNPWNSVHGQHWVNSYPNVVRSRRASASEDDLIGISFVSRKEKKKAKAKKKKIRSNRPSPWNSLYTLKTSQRWEEEFERKIASRLERLQEELRQVRGTYSYGGTYFDDLCLYPNAKLPPK